MIKKILKPIFQHRKNNILIKVLDSNTPIDISIIADNDEIYLNTMDHENLNNKIFSVDFDVNYVKINLSMIIKISKKNKFLVSI